MKKTLLLLINLATLTIASSTLSKATILYDLFTCRPEKPVLILGGSYKKIASWCKVGGIHEPNKPYIDFYLYQRINADAIFKYVIVSHTIYDCHVDWGSPVGYNSLDEIVEYLKDNFELVIEKF